MIKLTVNPHTRPIAYAFDKALVIIGAGTPSEVDLAIPEEQLEPIHLKIMEQGNRFIVVNQANDPFATINGTPFGKKAIQSDDIIEIGSTHILFEGVPTPPVSLSKDRGIASTAVELPAILDKVLTHKEQESAQSATNIHHTPSFESSSPLPHNGKESIDMDLEEEMRYLDAWLQETAQQTKKNPENIEPLFVDDDLYEQPLNDCSLDKEPAQEEPPKQEPSPKKTDAGSAKPHHKQGIKDLYFKDLEDSSKQKPRASLGINVHHAHSPMDWHTIWIIVVGVISTIAIVALLLYANATGKSEDDELRAAEGIADVAMALAYAQLNNIVPQNQNWSDPEFLKNTLAAVLSPEYPLLAQLDSHGQFSNSPYLLRIYTSSDLSNFLVIAQPEPSLLHWLIPKSAILVSSADMQLRKTTDLKSFNRLLINPTLDGPVAQEVANSVKRAEPIALSSISKKQHHLGFSPPKALALIRPGAENRIYNAPRYHNFGESILRKAIALADNRENTHEIMLLKQEIEALGRYPNFVMYSTQGLQAARQAQQSLSLFEPNATFLIAYMQFDAQREIQGSHLLIDDGTSELAMANTPLPSVETGVDDVLGAGGITHTAITHPLFFELSALSSSRQQTLKPLSQEIVQLLEEENLSTSPNFPSRLKTLVDQYLQEDSAQQAWITQGMTRLYQRYSNAMSLSEFMGYAHSAGMEAFAQEGLKKQIEKQTIPALSPDAIVHQIRKIQESTTWEQLEDETLNVQQLFTLENISDPAGVIVLQNQAKKEILDKVSSFILSSNSQLPTDAFNTENKGRLERILKMAWINDPEESDYYLKEFDFAAGEKLSAPPPVNGSQQPISLKDYQRFWQQGRPWKKMPR